MKFAWFGRAALPGLVVVVGGLLAACPGPGTGTPDAGDGGGGDPLQCRERTPSQEPCKKNIDCPQGAICEKESQDDEFGCCLKVLCQSDEDCGAEEKCDLRRGICVPENLCDPANPELVCPGGTVCIYQEGVPQCIDVGQLPVPGSCTIAPNPVYAKAGEAVQLEAVGLSAAGELVPFAEFTFSPSTGLGTTDANGKLTAECATPGADGTCTGTVTATSIVSSAATCEATVRVYPVVPDGTVRVVLFDQTTGAPIQGAQAALKLVGDATVQTATTNAAGIATFTAAVADVEALSAFSADHQWQTVVRPASNDIALYTVRVPGGEEVTGVKGKFNFDDVHTQGDIKLGLAGTAISAAVTDLDFTTLVGEIADYPVNIEGVTTGEQLVPLPSGLYLELGTTPIKGEFVVFGEEDTSILWALGGKVRLAEIGPIISSVTASGDDINVGSVLSAVLPFFAKFDHAVVTGLDLPDPAVVADPDNNPDTPTPYDVWPFPALEGADAVKLNTLLSQSATYTIPTLPCAAGAAAGGSCTNSDFASGAIVLGGVVVPGQGIVPLGLTAGLDDPNTDDGDQFDGKIDWESGGAVVPASGDVILDYAPPHDGLEGNLFISVALALDLDALTENEFGASILSHVTDKYEATAKNQFPHSFLEHQGGTFTGGANASFSLDVVGDADFYRVNLDDGGNGEWNIWFDDPSLASAGLDIASFRPATGEGSTGRDLDADVQAFRLGSGYETLPNAVAPSTFDELMGFNGTNADNLLYYLGAWVSTPCEATGSFCVRQ